MNLLYLPNETSEVSQNESRHALNNLLINRQIDNLTIFSYRKICDSCGSWEKTLEKLLQIIEQTQPSSILVQHVGNYHFPQWFFDSVKSISKSKAPIVAYDERDVFGYIRKPLPTSVKNFCKHSDVIFLDGAGKYAERFRRMGNKNVCYLPNAAEASIPLNDSLDPLLTRDYDVIMIANNTKSRIPFLSMPGANERERLAKKINKIFGKRFALVGRGWQKELSPFGFVPKNDSITLIRQSWINLGQDHFYNYEGYFSDRLPNALITGTAYVCRYVPGLENILVDGYHCRMFNTIGQAIEICEEMLKGQKDELIQMGKRGAELARELLIEDVRMKRIVEKLKIYEKVKK